MTEVRVRSLACADDTRRGEVRAHDELNGIDFIEVVTSPAAENQRVLEVFFLEKTSATGQTSLSELLDEIEGTPSRVTIEGGVRIRPIRVRGVERTNDHLRVTVSEPGDFSTYTLRITSSRLDPAYAACDFSFKAGCPSRFDCRPRTVCPPDEWEEPLVDYMAKDYASFRRALLDLVSTRLPAWQERHEADLGITLLELLAYVGDQLSYYQDAVANEAFLQTARQRQSVRRHALLVDYRMHEGASARTFVHVRAEPGGAGYLPAGTAVLTTIDAPLGPAVPPHPTVLTDRLADRALDAAEAVFETVDAVRVDPALNRLRIHAWGNRQCCFPRGTTTLDLVGDLAPDPEADPPVPGRLRPDDLLLLEEVLGPPAGLPQDADLAHRQVVRLTQVERTADPLPDPPLLLTRLTWGAEDALTFPLCVSVRWDDEDVADVSVARGNVVLADHGRRLVEEHPADPEKGIRPGRRGYRFLLREAPISYRLPSTDSAGDALPVRDLLTADPHLAEAQVTLEVEAEGQEPTVWTPVSNLLDSEPFDLHVAVEPGNDRRALVRFGDGEFGARPPEGARIAATYRIGAGARGNVGPDSLAHIVNHGNLVAWPGITAVRNPLAAWGGSDPEPIERVKQLAPPAFHAVQHRAVTTDDYARVAERHPDVSRAVATFRWTGSWHTVFLAVDPSGVADVSPELEARVRAWVAGHTQAAYDLEIDGPILVPLEIEIDVCVHPDHFRADVEQALLDALSSSVLPDGRRGFFYPDRFTFAQPLYLSELYAAIEAVEGVDSAVVTVFKRFAKTAGSELEHGYVPAGRLEILRLDNDPNFPENGTLRLTMRGGK